MRKRGYSNRKLRILSAGNRNALPNTYKPTKPSIETASTYDPHRGNSGKKRFNSFGDINKTKPPRVILANVKVNEQNATSTPTCEPDKPRSEEHTSELQSRPHLVCRLLLEKKK